MAKKRQTFGKITRERERAEKRERKQEKKAEKKEAAVEARDAGLGGMRIGPPNQQGAEDEGAPLRADARDLGVTDAPFRPAVPGGKGEDAVAADADPDAPPADVGADRDDAEAPPPPPQH